MIEGLKVNVQGTELRELCLKESRHHSERAEFYASKVAALQGVEMEAKMSGGNPVEQLESKRRQHEQSRDELQFIADHLVATETYYLGREDLVRIGVVSRGW